MFFVFKHKTAYVIEYGLVGSEMCIRDRIARDPKDSAAYNRLGRAYLERRDYGTAYEAYMDCLLYTSDAADELLCVDLGGRRSIKKKKKHKINVDYC